MSSKKCGNHGGFLDVDNFRKVKTVLYRLDPPLLTTKRAKKKAVQGNLPWKEIPSSRD